MTLVFGAINGATITTKFCAARAKRALYLTFSANLFGIDLGQAHVQAAQHLFYYGRYFVGLHQTDF